MPENASAKHSYLQYAYKNRKVVHVDEVANGLACGCTCPYCGAPLVARQGNVLIHHFAHVAAESTANGWGACHGIGESSEHLAAKHILTHAKKLRVPALTMMSPEPWTEMCRKIKIAGPRMIPLTDVRIEERAGEIIPDVTAALPDGTPIYIEIKRSHAVEDEKRQTYIDAGAVALEIDIGEAVGNSNASLEDLVLKQTKNKKWLSHPDAIREWNKLADKAEERDAFLIDKFHATASCPYELTQGIYSVCLCQCDGLVSVTRVDIDSEEARLLCCGRYMREPGIKKVIADAIAKRGHIFLPTITPTVQNGKPELQVHHQEWPVVSVDERAIVSSGEKDLMVNITNPKGEIESFVLLPQHLRPPHVETQILAVIQRNGWPALRLRFIRFEARVKYVEKKIHGILEDANSHVWLNNPKLQESILTEARKKRLSFAEDDFCASTEFLIPVLRENGLIVP